jgi:small-conductance mechanosensitive channel
MMDGETHVEQNPVIHALRGGRRIAYGSDVEHARNALLNVVSSDKRILTVPAPNVVLDALAPSSIDLNVMCFVENVNDRLPLGSDRAAAIEAERVSNAAILADWRTVSVSTDFLKDKGERAICRFMIFCAADGRRATR